MAKTPLEIVRLDRWLSSARFYKTRTQSAKACEGGKIKVNGKRAKPHKFLRIGDRITLHHRGHYRDIEVVGLAERGLPPKEARTLYHEEAKQTLSEEEEELFTLYRKSQGKQPTKWKGRPTKKARRELEKLKNMFNN